MNTPRGEVPSSRSERGRVLVTGASGCVGRYVLGKLSARGWDVQAVHSRTDAIELPGVSWIRANLLEPMDVRDTVRRASASHLLHLAWNIQPGQWAASPENVAWVRASLDLVSEFRLAGGTRTVFAGSCLEYDWDYGYCSEGRTPLQPKTLYGRCKHALQLMTTPSTDHATAWARVFFLYGPHEHPDRLVAAVIRSILAGEPARTSHGRQIRDYLYVDDVADVLVRLLESDFTGQINVGSGQPVALRDIVQKIGELMGRPDLLEIGAIPAASTDTPLVVADTTLLRSALDWTPAWDLTRGLEATIDWWRRQ